MNLTALAINCTLKGGRKQSSTDRLLKEILAQFEKHDVDGEILRAADFNILPGVEHDEGDGDDWPKILDKIRAADIFILGTPIWLGQPSSIAKRVCERMDAFLDDTDENKRMLSYGKVACVAVVGNEDGAHHVSAELFQALNDVGFSLAPAALTYWVGMAMGDVNYVDLDHAPRKTTEATEMMVLNTVHLATALRSRPFPGKTK
ncbi:MAG TPA: NAD(P)H-dependent oxidoreductase [Rhizomicrobium sp.]|jgi:multimeric flavodoxin WrbA|nr:NAD(P)H-dependent oxidoreductase [Rhizomicrobium sp.]